MGLIYSHIVTKGVGWKGLGMGTFMLRDGIIVEDVGIIDTRDEIEMGTDVMSSGR